MRNSFIVCVAMFAVTFPIPAGEPTPAEVFEKRIVPIFKSPNPSSCVQCHLAGVDLKQYILPSSDKTFVSLRDQGMIDLDSPEKSKILKLISMGEKDRRATALIHAKMRQAEFEAFADWIKAAGATWADVVKTNTFVTDFDEFQKCGDVRMRYVGVATPTSTTVGVTRLAGPDFMIEIEAVAVVNS